MAILWVLHGLTARDPSHGAGSFSLILQPDPDDPEGPPLRGLPAQLATRAIAIGLIDDDALPDLLAINARGEFVGNGSLTFFRGTAPFLFAPGESFLIGAGPEALLLFDLDRDGALDAITADSTDNVVSVLFGNDDGTFEAPRGHRVGEFPVALVVGDVNGDRFEDLVTANGRSQDVSVLIGDGNLAAARTYVTAPEPSAVTLADMDGDGDLDIVAAHGGDAGEVAVTLNRGDGTYESVQDLLVGTPPSTVATADVDNDALPDLVVATETGPIAVFRNLSGAGFAPPAFLASGGRPAGMSVRDRNGDQRADIAFADKQGAIGVMFGRRNGTFSAVSRVVVPPEPSGITAGDFNADGRLDLAVTINTGPPGQVAVALQNADGTFGVPGPKETRVANRQFAADATPRTLAADDFNGDRRDDLVVINEASNSVMVFRARADGNFDNVQTLSDPRVVGTRPFSLELADFNRDGEVDFVVGLGIATGSGTTVKIFDGNGDGTFSPGPDAPAGLLISSLVARDFNYNGMVDLAVVNQASNAVAYISALPTGGFGLCQTDILVSRMPVTIAAADFDDDGRYDLTTGNSDGSAVNASIIRNCLGDEPCPIQTPIPGFPFVPCDFTEGVIPVRGDGNGDRAVTAADLVAVSGVVVDVNGTRAEEINVVELPAGFTTVDPGVDANGDGLVDPQDRIAVARRIFGS